MQLDLGGAVKIFQPLIVIINGDRQHDLGLLLPDDIVIEQFFDGRRAHALMPDVRLLFTPLPAGARRLRTLAVQQVIAEHHAFVADVYARTNEHPLHFIFGFSAKRTAKRLVFIRHGRLP